VERLFKVPTEQQWEDLANSEDVIKWMNTFFTNLNKPTEEVNEHFLKAKASSWPWRCLE
jgi:hypothetical protein